jgi:hypothetical protein
MFGSLRGWNSRRSPTRRAKFVEGSTARDLLETKPATMAAASALIDYLGMLTCRTA